MPKVHSLIAWLGLLLSVASSSILTAVCLGEESQRPNILFAISDDQSYPYASAYGTSGVHTPAFDRVAKEGVLFNNAFHASPGCSPCRAAILTGRHTWELEEAGTHASSFPQKFIVFPDLLENAGYFIGFTGKGWGPGNFIISGRDRSPAGPAFQKHKLENSPKGISSNDYAANFADFLKQRPEGQPFYFWYGAFESHRGYEKGAGLRSGKKREEAVLPSFLPETPEIREDILDYSVEIEHFDNHLGRMLKLLEDEGELENTLVIVTSDNGMPFPRAKANCYEYGIHAPLAIRWGNEVPGGRTVDDLVGFVDYAPTILEAAGVKIPAEMRGRSLLPVLKSKKEGVVDASRNQAFSARERHSSSRYNNWTYPQRALRTPRYLYIRNFHPERWPAGDPAGVNGAPYGYHDIDACPTLEFLWQNRENPELARYFQLAVAKRPAEELFNIVEDPGCLNNLAEDPKFQQELKEARTALEAELRRTGDPRILNGGEVWETYPRYSPIRTFPAPEQE